MMTHLRRDKYNPYIRPECEERPIGIKGPDLAYHIREVDCLECLEEKKRKAIRDLTDCEARLRELRLKAISPQENKVEVGGPCPNCPGSTIVRESHWPYRLRCGKCRSTWIAE